MTDYNNLKGLRHSEQLVVECRVRELEQSGKNGSNPFTSKQPH